MCDLGRGHEWEERGEAGMRVMVMRDDETTLPRSDGRLISFGMHEIEGSIECSSPHCDCRRRHVEDARGTAFLGFVSSEGTGWHCLAHTTSTRCDGI